MKKHSKKFFAALALILALACALTACAPAAASSGNAESKASETPVSSKAEEKPVTPKYINYGAKPDTGNCDGIWKAMNDILLKDLNCTVDVEYLGSGDKAQMALKYAGNEKFDFTYSANWFGFADNAQNNAFRALTMDELKQYAPYMVENLPDIAWKQASVNGKIYMLPSMSADFEQEVIMYRGDLLEKYGMSELKTMADFEEYVSNVAEQEIGIEAMPASSQLWFNIPYGYETTGDWTFRYTNPDVIEFILDAMADEYITYAKKIRSFYEKGILAPDLINDTTNVNEKFKNGLLASTFHNTGTLNTYAIEINKTHPEWKVRIFNPYAGYKVITRSYTGNGTTISRSSNHPTKVIEVINHIYESDKLQKLLNFGVEGVDYQEKGGKVEVIPDVPADKKMKIGCNWNFYNKLKIETFVVTNYYDGVQEIYDDFKKNNVSHPLQAFMFDKTAVETEISNITAAIKEHRAHKYGMIADVDAAVAEYRAALKAAGYDKVKAEYDRQVKEFMATYNN